MKNLIFFFFFFFSTTIFSQCINFYFEKHISGKDFVNFEWRNRLDVCELDKTINFGEETFYITQSKSNLYGDFIYYIKEAAGYGWPEIGYVKIASTLDVVELKFMNSIVQYEIISSYEKEIRDKEVKEKIEAENKRLEQLKALEDEKKLNADKQKYIQIDKLINEEKWQDAAQMLNVLSFPNSYPKHLEISDKILQIKKIEDSISSIKINLKIKEFDLDSATFLYKKMNFENLTLKKSIENALIEKYSTEVKSADVSTIRAFINDNKSKLLSMAPTTFKVTLKQDGTFEGISSDYITKSVVAQYKTINGFKVPIPLSFDINITNGSPKKVENSEKIFINTYKEVRIKKNGKVYITNFFNNSSYLHKTLAYYNPDQQKEFIKEHPKLDKLNIIKGHYVIVETSQFETFVNGEIIGVNSIETVGSQIKMTKRIPKIVFRSLTLPLYLIWYVV
jgi:hypothetical protein